MKEAWTKNGSSPFRSSHAVSASTMKAVSDCSAVNRAGAQVEPWLSAPAKSGMGWYSSWGLAGTSTPWAASHRPHCRLPASHGSWSTARKPGSTSS